MKKLILGLLMLSLCFPLSAQSKKSGRKRKIVEQVAPVESEEETAGEEKEKKFSFFYSMYKPNISSAAVEEWSGVFRSYSDSDLISYSKQYKDRTNYNFNAPLAFNIGVSKKVKISSAFDFTYGVGLDLMSFTYSTSSTTLEERIIDKYELISNGTSTSSVYNITSINPEIVNEETGKYYSGYQGDITHSIYALIFPMKLRYEVFSRCYITGNLGITLPVITQTKGLKYLRATFEKEFATENSGADINRFIINTGLGLNYKILDNTSLGINYSYAINSLFNPSVGSTNYDYYNMGKVNFSAIGVSLNYDF